MKFSELAEKLEHIQVPVDITNRLISKIPMTQEITPSIINKIQMPPKYKRRIMEELEADTFFNKLSSVQGIGEVKARELIKKGLTKFAQLKQKKWLNLLSDEAQAYVKYNPETNIPRATIKELEPVLTKPPKMKAIIAGSYRRELNTSADIDLVLISADPEAIDKYIEFLKKKMKVVIFAQGLDKAGLLIQYKTKYYKMDILKTTPEEKAFMLLYANGSRIFNIRMRIRAKKLGYLLNQRGLFKNGKSIPAETEKEIFEKLEMKYLPPKKRQA